MDDDTQAKVLLRIANFCVILAVVLLALAVVQILVSPAHAQEPPRVCKEGAIVVHWLGTMRDQGVSEDEMQAVLHQSQFGGVGIIPGEAVRAMAVVVYRHADVSPAELAQAFFSECMMRNAPKLRGIHVS